MAIDFYKQLKKMKKTLTLFALLACVTLFAQHKVANKVAEYQRLNARFSPFSVLTAVNQPADSEVSRAVKKSTLAQINMTAVNDIVANQYETIELAIPYEGQTVLVDLYKANPFNENFHVDTDKAKNIAYQRGVYYRGIVKGDENSIASFNFFNGEFNGIVSATGLNNLVIGKLDKKNNNTDYIVYSDAEMRVLNGFNCGMKEEDVQGIHDHEGDGQTQRSMLTDRCVTMYFEVDYDLFFQNNESETETTDWMTAAFNNMQTLYENDGITVALKSIYIWTEPDPYEGIGESSSDYLFAFNFNRPVFDGDVGQLVGIDPGGLGGVAVTIEGLCSQNNFSYSDVSFSFSTVPTWSWTVQVITHEMGHLLGSRHTHACVWNGNGTSIDGCGTQAGFTEGSCALGPIPSTSVKGTIMSYCHLINGVGISFNNGFGPQPAAAIVNAVESSGCLSTDCVNTCINTVVNITTTFPSNNQATITWSDLGNSTSWEVSVSTFLSTVDNWIMVNTPTYTTPANLNINSYYKIKIRPICESAEPTSRTGIFATPAAWCNGVTITDTGGINNDYTNDQSYVRTLIPNLPQKKIKIEFSAFNLEQDFDFLTIFDGPNTDSPSFGAFTGEFVSSPIVSSSPDGSLTLQFFADQGVVESGFVGLVTCLQNLATGEFEQNIDFTYSPNPTNGIVSIISNTEMEDIKVYNVQGQLLYQSQHNGLTKNVDLGAFATGTYFFKMNFAGDKQVNFKIVKN